MSDGKWLRRENWLWSNSNGQNGQQVDSKDDASDKMFESPDFD